MLRSTDRILTTHTGSLPRPADLLELIQAREAGQSYDPAALADRVRTAVDECVRKQVQAGIDVVSDGELSKPSFASYVTHRLGGFGGENPEPRISKDIETFPDWGSSSPRPQMKRKYAEAPLSYANPAEVQADVRNLQSAAKAHGAGEAFIPSASIGIIADIMVNKYYPSEEDYLFAIADVMHEEYKAITDAGLVLQIDAPDAAMGRHMQYRNESLDTFRKWTTLRVDALNRALEGIPAEQVRYHICWGNNESPHVNDVPLKDVVDLVFRVNAAAYSIEASNPRHAHEWKLWQDVQLPAGKVLIPGVIDSTTNFVEHPELVADRIENFARLVGRENVIAGTDCGFGTSAGRSSVHPEVVWAKLKTLSEGAEIASKRLWGK